MATCNKQITISLKIHIVIPAGLEPATRSLEGCCSIQLSYETISAKSGCKINNNCLLSNSYFNNSSIFFTIPLNSLVSYSLVR